MQHTYLRYECADTFSLTTATPSTTTNTTQILALLDNSPSSESKKSNNLVVSIAGSQCVAFNLRSGNPPRPFFKFGHYDDTTNIGTGKALNSSECTCIDIYVQKVGTGWIDGSIRIFDVGTKDANRVIEEGLGVVHSLLDNGSKILGEDAVEPPLVLNGHSNSPITCVSFDKANKGSRLASGSADGSVVVWDVIAETGLFRLSGHNKTISTLHFLAPKIVDTNQNIFEQSDQLHTLKFDGLVTTSLDGLAKVWDLDGQCCAQTIGGHRGEIWTSDCAIFEDRKTDSSKNEVSSRSENRGRRWRMVTGASDNELRFWAIHGPRRSAMTDKNGEVADEVKKSTQSSLESHKDDILENEVNAQAADEDTISYMGSLQRQSNERASLVKFYAKAKLLAVSAHQSKNIEVYYMRSVIESEKRRVRRLRRRREKDGKKKFDKSKVKVKGLLDDDDDENYDGFTSPVEDTLQSNSSPERICASDEFGFLGMVRASHKVRGFVFAGTNENRGGTRLILSLATNTLEVHSIQRNFNKEDGTISLNTKKLFILDQYGHPTGIRSISLSPTNEKLATSISKGMLKVWSIPSRSCIRSLPLHYSNENQTSSAVYALCCAFLPSNAHVVVGTREGHILIIDIASGDVVFIEEEAHEGAIWDLDVKSDGSGMMTGSADHSAKFWEFEDSEDGPTLLHTRTLEMKDDVVCVGYSFNSKKRLVMICTLDCTIQILFEDNLKFFLNLYGHKLPALGMDCSDDDAILASGGADKTIKIWGLDFGDIHKTLHGHTDSITDVKFVKKTHNFFSCARDKTIRYWDGDRFCGILVLHGHFAEVNSLAISKTGAYVLSAGMDRQIRVWERTKDMVFIEEEKDREMERILDQADGSKGEEKLSMQVIGVAEEHGVETQPQSEAAVRRSVLSIASGDRIMEAIELADAELKDRSAKKNKKGSTNLLLLGMEPHQYIFWVLRTVKSAELEQSLLVLPLKHTERLMHYLIILLRNGIGVEICSKVALFLITTHQNQIIATHALSVPLRELRRLMKKRLKQCLNTVGYNLAAMRAVAKTVHDNNKRYYIEEDNKQNNHIWAGLGKGSDVAAALTTSSSKRLKKL